MFEAAYSGVSEEVDGARFGVVDVLDTDEGLGDQGLCKVEVEVREIHHGNTHVRGAELLE